MRSQSSLIYNFKLNAHIFLLLLGTVVFTACGGGGGGEDSGGGGGGGGGGGPTTYSVSGTVVAAEGTAIDSDVNDPDAPYTFNNTVAAAQSIPNPVSVSGYANQPGSGLSGRSQASGDASDVYKVALTANQTITLSIADTINGDLDLFLADAQGNLLASSEGTSTTETITVTTAGEYLVEVFAYAGASNYVLALTQGGLAAVGRQESSLSVMHDFVAEEGIVKFKEATSQKTAVMNVQRWAGNLGIDFKAGHSKRASLIRLGRNDVQKNIQKSMLGITATDQEVISSEDLPALLRNSNIDTQKIRTIRMIKALRQRDDIDYAYPNHISYLNLAPNDKIYSYQWHYPLINLEQAWDITTGSNTVLVAVIDSGVLFAHPDLQGKFVAGYDFVSDPQQALDGDGIDNNPDDPGDGAGQTRSSFHGTHVAGTISAASNNALGVSGVSWSTLIMPVRVAGLGGMLTDYDLIQGIRFAAGLDNDSGTVPARRADIINMSLGSPVYNQVMQDSITEARNAGVILIAAAGNANSSVANYPAANDGVVSVSAVGPTRTRAPYSSYGPTVDIAAPGGDASTDVDGDGYPDGVLSTCADDSQGAIKYGYIYYEGTSMATPHIAGVVALMKAVRPTLTPAELDSFIASGAITNDIGAPGKDDDYGYGLIDAAKAVAAAQSMNQIPARVNATPAALNFSSVLMTTTLLLQNGGTESLTINLPTDDANWLTVTPNMVDADNIGSYTVTVDRSGLTEGTYTATISVSSTANSITIPVIMTVSNNPVVADAGRQYVVLVRASDFSIVTQQQVASVAGRYPYSLTNVPAGDYYVIAGSNNNNDTYLCDGGETCGAYLTLEAPVALSVNSNLSGIDFVASAQPSIVAQSVTDKQRRVYALPGGK